MLQSLRTPSSTCCVVGSPSYYILTGSCTASFFNCQQTYNQQPLNYSVESYNYHGQSHHTNKIVSSFRYYCLSIFLVNHSREGRWRGSGQASLLFAKHYFSRETSNKISSLNKSFLIFNGVKYKTLTQASCIYIKRRLKYSWMSMPLQGMKMCMGLHDSTLVKA